VTPKIIAKENALSLRRQGKTYNEILAVVPVAKSTLSLWLREVELCQKQVQRITAKRRTAQLKGALARKKQRLSITSDIVKAAQAEVGALSARERFLVGVALYWAEGSKQRERTVSQGLTFNNTDPAMIYFFLSFLREQMKISRSDIHLTLYIHEDHKYRLERVVAHWRKELHEPKLVFGGIYYKNHNSKTNRTKIDETYFGTVRVRVRRSTNLQRKISGWICGIISAQ
jgi:hypothetical protein